MDIGVVVPQATATVPIEIVVQVGASEGMVRDAGQRIGGIGALLWDWVVCEL